jgi:osmoprotectant transport system ATP-binding protein
MEGGATEVGTKSGALAIELRGVSKRYGHRNALETTNLGFKRGETTALIGPSGCGKSTLLRLIVGLVKPSAGTIALDGEVLNPDNLTSARRKLGYVIQEGGLFPHLNAADNVLLMLRHLKAPEDKNQSRLKELADLVRLPNDLLNRFPAELSGGQRQRVSLMRALALDPEILLLDEPLGALDPMVRNVLQQELKYLFEKLKKTVILVTHDMAEAAYLSHSIVLLREGKIVQNGALADFQNHPSEAFVSEFLGAQRSLVQL